MMSTRKTARGPGPFVDKCRRSSPCVYVPGVCRICGCTELSPCIFEADFLEGNERPELLRCSWMDAGRTLCSNLHCVAQVPLDELVAMCAAQLRAAAAVAGR
jgi:hypothetical protein